MTWGDKPDKPGWYWFKTSAGGLYPLHVTLNGVFFGTQRVDREMLATGKWWPKPIPKPEEM